MANGDEKIMENWFPMALKDGARSWLLNLTEGSVCSWEEMRSRFIANFQGTRYRLPAAGDLRRIKQQPGETLQKYIQRFNNVRLKIPKVSDEAIISVFADGVRDVKMKSSSPSMRISARPWRCSTWRTSAQGLRKEVSPSSSSPMLIQKTRRPRPGT